MIDKNDNPMIARAEADYARHEDDLQWEDWAEAQPEATLLIGGRSFPPLADWELPDGTVPPVGTIPARGRIRTVTESFADWS